MGITSLNMVMFIDKLLGQQNYEKKDVFSYYESSKI